MYANHCIISGGMIYSSKRERGGYHAGIGKVFLYKPIVQGLRNQRDRKHQRPFQLWEARTKNAVLHNVQSAVFGDKMHGIFRNEVFTGNCGRHNPYNRGGKRCASHSADARTGQERREPGDFKGGTTLREGLEKPFVTIRTHRGATG